MEAAIPRKYGADAVEIPGSRALLDDLEKVNAKWAIVTSGTRLLVGGWLDIMKLAHPKNLIAAEDVKVRSRSSHCTRSAMELSPGSCCVLKYRMVFMTRLMLSLAIGESV